MFRRIVIISVLMFLVAGCAKKTPKFTGASSDSAATPPPRLPVAPAKKDDKKTSEPEKANGLTDPRLNKDGGWGVTPPAGGWTPPIVPAQQPGTAVPPQPAKPPVAPVTGQPTLPAFRPVAEADMKEVWIFIENRSGATGRMPASADVLIALIETKANAAGLVADGSITLTGAKTRESIWAFESKGIAQGGWVATQNGVENLSAAEMKRRLGR